MQPDRAERLSGIVAALSEYINVVRRYHLRATAVLLDAAKLDLQMRIHSISDQEFHALCDALETARPDVCPAGSEAASSHNGEHPVRIVAMAGSANDIIVRPGQLRRMEIESKRSNRVMKRLRKGV